MSAPLPPTLPSPPCQGRLNCTSAAAQGNSAACCRGQPCTDHRQARSAPRPATPRLPPFAFKRSERRTRRFQPRSPRRAPWLGCRRPPPAPAACLSSSAKPGGKHWPPCLRRHPHADECRRAPMAPPTRSPLAPARLRLLAALLVAAASMLPLAEGHGFMSEPQARNYLHNWRYCPHCGESSQLPAQPLAAGLDAGGATRGVEARRRPACRRLASPS